MTAPAIVIRIAIEAKPLVYVDALSDGEEARVLDWMRALAALNKQLGRQVPEAL